MRTPRVWFVTGASRGIGRAIAEQALAAGDLVVAGARRPEALRPLRDAHGDRLSVVRLDVDDRAEVFSVVDDAVETFGRLDVVVNNAGWGLMGAVEEVTEEEARAQMATNFFGALWVTQAVLPHLRRQGGGHLMQVSTVGAIGTFPTLGLYNASKWALEGLSEALAAEVGEHGVRVTMLQPGGFATEWATASMRHATPLPAYDGLRASLFGGAEAQETAGGGDDGAGTWTEGDPVDLARAVIDLAGSSSSPLRVLVGDDAPLAAKIALERRRDQYEQDPLFQWPAPTHQE
jgi:NAD(P)-dependent dehydrogenase (short-subunit alcohol dehydrogenase family)